MHERIARIIPGDNSDIAAAAVVRIAVCHYVIAVAARVSSSPNYATPRASTRLGAVWRGPPVAG